LNTKQIFYMAALRIKKAQYWIIAHLAFTLLNLVRLLPAQTALNFVDRAARAFGPLMGRNRVAMANLRAAFPEKAESELKAIASDMWGNMARLAAEYVFLDKIAHIDSEDLKNGNVDVEGIELFLKLRESKKPRIFFTAHMGNFELLPICAATFGLEVTALFRPPNNPYIAKRLLASRETAMGQLVPSKAGASFALARILEADGNVGVLVDQKFSGGVDTTFFGRPCQTNPLLGKLARQFDCDVHPAVCTRKDDGRFLIRVQDRIDLPRNSKGKVDVNATAQLLNDIVEEWVREDPGQWMWFHKRWQVASKRRPRRKG
jgi:KDO2-lipid IV(A) lauroyltransferase